MSKQIHVNAFEMATPGHINQGVWALPGSRRTDYHTLSYWVDLARTIERGLFDGIFFADVVGTYNVYKNGRETAVRSGVQVPLIDPTLIISAMAAVTEHMGFAVTVNTTYESPFGWARRLATLDHITNGRFAWNVVTGYLADAARNFGLDAQVRHDDRYERADEFMEVIYELLEASWEDNAVIRDAAQGVYTDPARVHEIGFHGQFFDVAGPSLTEPSPQRTPLIYQAGTSERGMTFAAKHAEGVFMHPRDPEHARQYIEDIRARAVANGRRAEDIKPFVRLEVVTGESQEIVDARVRLIDEIRDVEGQLAAFGGWSGQDLSGSDTDRYLNYKNSDAIQSFGNLWGHGDNRKNVGELVQHLAKPSHDALCIFGTPDRIADQIEQLIDISGATGINLTSHFSPGTVRDFVDLVVPELQRRGRYRTQYTEGETFRERLYGAGERYVRPGHAARHAAAKRQKRAGAA